MSGQVMSSVSLYSRRRNIKQITLSEVFLHILLDFTDFVQEKIDSQFVSC